MKKTLFAATLLAASTLAQAQSIEADLDGNAGALQASEMHPGQQPRKSKVALRRTGTADPGAAVAMRR